MKLHRSEEANKAFSAAVQMHDVLVRGWMLWGDYLESLFTRERYNSLGLKALAVFMHTLLSAVVLYVECFL